MEGEAITLFKVWLTVLLSLSYCYFIVSKIPPGKFRFFSLLPIFSLFTLLPLCHSTVISTGITAFFITWLANSKLLLYSFNGGPLSHPPPQSLPRFILLAAFPIKIKQSNPNNHRSEDVLPLNFWSKALILSLFIPIWYYSRESGNPKFLMVMYCCMIYLFLEIVMGACNKSMAPILGVEMDRPSDEPYVSTSLRDFWGRRWNRTVSDELRHTVYRPVRSALAPLLGQKWAAVPAMMAAFTVSALMHELIFYYMARARPTWEVTCFFMLHGMLVVVELTVKGALGETSRVHWAVSGPFTVGLVMVTGFWLFFPQLVRNHVHTKAIEEGKALWKHIMEMIK